MRKLFTFKGRLGRLPFALIMLVAWGLAYSSMLRLLVDRAIHAVDPSYPIDRIPLAQDAADLSIGVATLILILAASFATVLPVVSLSLMARRLHDCNQTAWFVIPAIALPVIVPNLSGTILILPLGFLLLIAGMALMPGTRGLNRFDPAISQDRSGDSTAGGGHEDGTEMDIGVNPSCSTAEVYNPNQKP